jgi:hypothetical protein
LRGMLNLSDPKIMKKLLVITFAIFCFSGFCSSQLRAEGSDDWILDSPSCPVSIVLRDRRDAFIFSNMTNSNIAKIQLGLVKTVNNKSRVVRKGQFVNLPSILQKGQSTLSPLSSYEKSARGLISKSVLLAVIRVDFTDGSYWKIS